MRELVVSMASYNNMRINHCRSHPDNYNLFTEYNNNIGTAIIVYSIHLICKKNYTFDLVLRLFV